MVGALSENFFMPHPHSGEVVSVVSMIIGRLIVGHEKARQRCPGSDALYVDSVFWYTKHVHYTLVWI
jgi:hypothetical protein